jgi:hypothetical protein
MSDPIDPQESEHRGSALSFGLVLLLWGAFLYLYPAAAALPDWMQTIALFLAFVCFIFGAVVAGSGISDPRRSLFMTHFSIALAFALLGYAIYFLSERYFDRPDWVLAARLAVVPAALAAILMFGQSIEELLTGPAASASDQPVHAPQGSAEPRLPPQPDRVVRFERLAGAIIAFVSLAAAIMALVNEIRRGP